MSEQERTAAAFVRECREIRDNGCKCTGCRHRAIDLVATYDRTWPCELDIFSWTDDRCPAKIVAFAADAFGVPRPTDGPQDYLAARELEGD